MKMVVIGQVMECRYSIQFCFFWLETIQIAAYSRVAWAKIPLNLPDTGLGSIEVMPNSNESCSGATKPALNSEERPQISPQIELEQIRAVSRLIGYGGNSDAACLSLPGNGLEPLSGLSEAKKRSSATPFC